MRVMKTSNNRSYYDDNAFYTRRKGVLKIRHLLIALAIPAQIVFSDFSYAASRVFYDGFESGTTSAWNQDDSRNRCNVVTSAADGGSVRTGSRMLRCNWNGLVAWNDPASFEALVVNSWSYSREFLIRYWIRVDNNLSGGEGPKYFRIGSNSSGPATSFGALNVDGYQKLGMFNATSNIVTFWGGGSHAADHNWHKVELYIRQGASDGIVRMWEDGVQLVNFTNVNTIQSGGTWNPFHISSNWSGAAGVQANDTTNYVYWDEFEVYSDVSTGTAATGSLADASISTSSTSTITAPSNLTVQ